MIQLHRSLSPDSRRRLVPALLLAALCLAAAAHPALGCASSGPPPPSCGKTLALAKAVPGVVLLPGGGTFNVPSIVFFNLVDFPPGSGVCPAGPYFATLNLTATCNPGPGGGGMITVPIVPGFNPVTVPVTVGSGPPRSCAIAGTATVALADGTTLTAMGDSVACLAEPAPGNPTVPRLDMQVLGPAGSEIVRVHPGDQATVRVLVTNNDPLRTFSGELAGEMVNSSRLPGSSGAAPPGTGVYSISDPGAGDNFPIGFAEDLENGCLPLPPDPTDPTIPSLAKMIELDPGESIEIEVHARPWGMCADGSCGEGTLVLTGDFSDATPGIACVGYGVAVDTSVAPTYLWPDSGQAVQVLSPSGIGNFVTLSGAPTPMSEVVVDLETSSVALRLGGLLAGAFLEYFSAPLGPDRARTRIRISDGIGFDSFAEYALELEVRASWVALEANLQRMGIVPGAPTGFSDQAPVGEGLFELVDPGSSETEGYFELMYQVNAVAVDEVGERRAITFGSVDIRGNGDGSGFLVVLSEGQVAPGSGFVIEEVEVNQDFLGFMSAEPQIAAEIFSNGFESGDVAAWTLAKP